MDQRFVLDIPAEAVTEPRGYAIRVTVASKSVLNLSKVVGKTDVHLSYLKNEEPVVGKDHKRAPFSS